MGKLRKILIRLAIALVACIIVHFIVVYVVLPSREQWLKSQALSNALSDASLVSILEFTPFYFDSDAEEIIRKEVVLQRVIGTDAQIKQLRAATRSFVVLETSFVVRGCYTPHHRVEGVGRDGSTFRLDVCLSCRNFSFDKYQIEPIPPSWLPRLRQFFIDAGMPPRSDQEYLQVGYETMKAEQANSGKRRSAGA